MKKIFPYLSQRTARQLRMTAATRVIKIGAVVEAAIDAYSQALAVDADELQDVDLRRRNRLSLEQTARVVKARVKKNSVKVGTSISEDHHNVLLGIQGTGGFLSGAMELALTFHLREAPEARAERDSLTTFLWPPIDLPRGIQIMRFIRHVSGPF